MPHLTKNKEDLIHKIIMFYCPWKNNLIKYLNELTLETPWAYFTWTFKKAFDTVLYTG